MCVWVGVNMWGEYNSIECTGAWKDCMRLARTIGCAKIRAEDAPSHETDLMAQAIADFIISGQTKSDMMYV